MDIFAMLPVYGILFVLVAGTLIVKQNDKVIKGWLGEFWVNLSARYFLDKNVYHLVKNVTLPTEDSTTQIDHIIVSRYGVFVVETKNMKGWIFGNENDSHWTQKIYKHSNKFQNPLRQNYKHTKALEETLSLLPSAIFSVIVFVGDSEFKTPMPPHVTYAKGYIGYIKSKSELLLGEYEVQELLEKIETSRLKPGFETNRAHVENLQAKHGKSVNRRSGKPFPNPQAIVAIAVGTIFLAWFFGRDSIDHFPKQTTIESDSTPNVLETQNVNSKVHEELNKVVVYHNRQGQTVYTNAQVPENSKIINQTIDWKTDSMPIEIIGDKIYVQVTIGNNGVQLNTSLILDKNNNKTTLPMRIADSIDAENAKVTGFNTIGGNVVSGETRRVSYLNIGSVVESDFIFLATASGNIGRRGILGMDFINKHPFKIDRKNKVLIWL